MIEPRSTATIRALAQLAEISANQLEEGASVEDVIATLRKAAEAVRLAVEPDDAEAEDGTGLADDLTPMAVSVGDTAATDTGEPADDSAQDEAPVLNAG